MSSTCGFKVLVAVVLCGDPAGRVRGVRQPVGQLASVESFVVDRRPGGPVGGDIHRTGQGADPSALLNCHPAGDRPRQGDTSRLHQPPVERGADGYGLPAMRCPICHQQANFDPARRAGQSDLASRPA